MEKKGVKKNFFSYVSGVYICDSPPPPTGDVRGKRKWRYSRGDVRVLERFDRLVAALRTVATTTLFDYVRIGERRTAVCPGDKTHTAIVIPG